jgi:NTE family protein
MARIALYLAGGGARGAYQAGVLKAIYHILESEVCPFTMISGVSVGSINAAIIAQHANDFATGVEKLEALWSTIHCQQVYNASNYELSKSLARNLSHFIIKQRKTGHLLDTAPLYSFIKAHVNFDQIRENIANGYIETVEVISNCYELQQTISFYEHHAPMFNDWHLPRHASQRAVLTTEHILASSALPLFFPTVTIDGFHYGDGSMGLVSPLRGALRFNVDKILILGTRQHATIPLVEKWRHADIGFAHILGNMLNGLFLDNLDRDIETVNHMNDIAKLLSIWKKRHSPWRPVETLHLRPSTDVAAMAQDKYRSMPTLLRLCLNFLGAQHHSGDLLSFLLFEKEFTQELINLGYHDTLSHASRIQAFFND